MGYLLMTLGLSTPLIFMFKIEWLFDKKGYFIILSCDFLFFLFSLLMLNDGGANIFRALQIPLFSTLVFGILYLGYKKIYKRDPKNTFWTFSKQRTEDVFFTLLFWILGAGLPMLILL